MASQAATRIGDNDLTHCSTPARAVGSPTVFVNGIAWSRQGDNNTPHLLPGNPCPTHAASIARGSRTVTLDPARRGGGRIGDAISGCTAVAQGSPNVFCGDESTVVAAPANITLTTQEVSV